jgi:hypothetical protein
MKPEQKTNEKLWLCGWPGAPTDGDDQAFSPVGESSQGHRKACVGKSAIGAFSVMEDKRKCHRCGGLYIPFAAPWMQEIFPHRVKIFCAHYTRTGGFCSVKILPLLRACSPQNPPVLLRLKRVCQPWDSPFSAQRPQKV